MARYLLATLLILAACNTQHTPNITPDGAPMTSNDQELPASGPDGWSQSGTLTPGNKNKQVTLQANFPKTDTYTIQFNVDRTTFKGIGAGASAQFTEALITWSVEGNDVTRKVTIADGVSVTGVGQAVRVVITDNSIIGGSTTASPYVASAQVSKGTRAPSASPPVYIDPSTIATQINAIAGTVASFTPPEGIGANSLLITAQYLDGAGVPRATAPLGTLTAKIQAGSGLNMSVYEPRAAGFVPIPPGATQVTIEIGVTGAAGDVMVVTPIWGIDG
jgi:hypothetical protein